MSTRLEEIKKNIDALKIDGLGLRSDEEREYFRSLFAQDKSFEEIAGLIVEERKVRNPATKDVWLSPGGVAFISVRLGLMTKESLIEYYAEKYRTKAKVRSEFQTIRKRVLQRDENKCMVCRSSKNLQVDHILALSSGGKNEVNNCITLCRACHEKKTNGVRGHNEDFFNGYVKAIQHLGVNGKFEWCPYCKTHHFRLLHE